MSFFDFLAEGSRLPPVPSDIEAVKDDDEDLDFEDEDSTDESTEESTENLLLDESGPNYIDFNGIRIIPRALVFKDVFERDTRTMSFSIQNIVTRTVVVRVEPPNIKDTDSEDGEILPPATIKTFVLDTIGTENQKLAPGMMNHYSVSYTRERQRITESTLHIKINGKSFEYCLLAFAASPNVIADPFELDFDFVDIGSPAAVRDITLYNTGALGTRFVIDLGKNELDMTVHPTNGLIRARRETKLRFELVGISEGEHRKEVWIKTTTQQLCIRVYVNVLQPHLVVHHRNTTGDFTLIDFPATYFGLSRREGLTLRNFSGQTSTVAVLAEVNNELICLREARGKIGAFSMFSIEPEEGRIEAFEGRVFILEFRPIKYVAKQAKKKQELLKDFLVFVRILRVQCIDYAEMEKYHSERSRRQGSPVHLPGRRHTEEDASLEEGGIRSRFSDDPGSPHSEEQKRECFKPLLSDKIETESTINLPTLDLFDETSVNVITDREESSEITIPDKQQLTMGANVPVIRLCLHGEAMLPEVELCPTTVDFGDISIGKASNRVLRITNKCSALPIHFKFIKALYFEMVPSEGAIGALGAIEVLIKARPFVYGVHVSHLKLDLLGRSEPVGGRITLVKVDRCKVEARFNCPVKPCTSIMKPEFNMGITPKLGNEVGRRTSTVTFASAVPKPWASVLRADIRQKRKWMKVKNEGEAIHASESDSCPADIIAKCLMDATDNISQRSGIEYERFVDRNVIKHDVSTATSFTTAASNTSHVSRNSTDRVISQKSSSLKLLYLDAEEISHQSALINRDASVEEPRDMNTKSVAKCVTKCSELMGTNCPPYTKDRRHSSPAFLTSKRGSIAKVLFKKKSSLDMSMTISRSSSFLKYPSLASKNRPLSELSMMEFEKMKLNEMKCLQETGESVKLRGRMQKISEEAILNKEKDSSSSLSSRNLVKKSKEWSLNAKTSKHVKLGGKFSKVEISDTKVVKSIKSGSSVDSKVLDEKEGVREEDDDEDEDNTSSLNKSETDMLLIQAAPFENPLNRTRKCMVVEKMVEPKCSKDPVNALIAFPNDRPASLRPWPQNKPVRTIFTGIPRYSAPLDPTETHTPAELRAKKLNEQVHIRWMRTYGAYSKAYKSHLMGKKVPLEEYDVSDRRLYQMLGLRPSDTLKLSSKELHSPSDPIAQVLLPLTPLQLYNVKVTPRAINFGQVAPYSFSYEKLKFENMNEFLVKVRILPAFTTLSFPEGDSKIIMPGTSDFIHLQYSSDVVGRYNGSVDYVINNNHSFKVILSSEVVPKELKLSAATLSFGQLPMEEAFQYRSEYVSIINSLQAGCTFKWDYVEESAYLITPVEGEVPAKSELLCEVLYTPNPKIGTTAQLILRDEGESDSLLSCSKVTHRYTVNFVNNLLDVKEIPLNLLRVFHTLLYNANYDDVTFVIANPVPIAGCSVVPERGVVCGRKCATIQIRIEMKFPSKFSFNVAALVPGSPVTELKVTGVVEYPQVAVTPDVVRFRQIRSDSFDAMEIHMTNSGNVEAHISIPMDDYPEFLISVTPKKHIPPFDKVGKFILHPGKTRSLFILFNPIDVATYEFYLPIIINNILGPPLIEVPESIKPEKYVQLTQSLLTAFEPTPLPLRLPLVRVDCTVAARVITFSTLHLFFSLFPGEKDRCKLEENVTVFNHHRKDVRFCIRTDDLNVRGSPFSLIYSSGVMPSYEKNAFVIRLEPGESVVFNATFKPIITGKYEVRAPIFLDGSPEGKVFNYLSFFGNYVPPTIRCNVKEIFFPPIPLSVSSGRTLNLDCYHHSKSTFISANIAEVPGVDVKSAVTILFPNSPTIRGLKGRVRVPVSLIFSSEVPTSFSTCINFRDAEDASSFSVHIVAIADNSVLTTHAFLKTKQDRYQVIKEHMPSMMNHSSSNSSEDNLIDEIIEYDNKPLSVLPVPSVPSLVPRELLTETTTPRLLVMHSRTGGTSQSILPDMVHYCSEMTLGTIGSSPLTEIKEENVDEDGEEEPSEDDEKEDAEKRETEEGDDVSMISGKLGALVPRATFDDSLVPFPFFPDGLDDTYSSHMHGTLQAVERWLFEQGFHCDFAVDIPIGITSMTAGYFKRPKTLHEKRKSAFAQKSILDVVVRLAGPSVLKFFTVKPLPEETNERIEFILIQYRQLIDLITKQGGCLAHITPEYLLTYEDYLTYVRKMRGADPSSPPQKCQSTLDDIPPDQREHRIFQRESDNQRRQNHEALHRLHDDCPKCHLIPTEEMFNSRSKQAWLDVVLQIAKTLWLSKISFEVVKEKRKRVLTSKPSTSSVYSSTSMSGDRCDFSGTSLHPLDSNIYSSPERILLAWLSSHFERQRDTLLAKESSSASVSELCKPILNFDSDLADGVVLAAVTSTYCPFLVPLFFSSLFTQPESFEQACHNAACLINAWRAVRLGFTVYVLDIVKPNSVFMVLLCAHLHNTLPTLYPRATVRFSTPLTTEVTRRIQLINPSGKRVAYKAEFLGDPQQFFRLEKPGSTFYLAGHDKAFVGVVFKARKISKVTGTLVLAGAAIAPNYARNITFRLEGGPSDLQVTSTFNLNTPLYRPTQLTLPIYPPFTDKATYEIWCTETEPQYLQTFTATAWKDLKARKVARRLFLNSSELEFDPEDRVASLHITVACIIPTTRTFWLIFVHPTVGDFIIKLVLSPKTNDILRHLTVGYPPNWTEVPCLCIHPRRHGLSDQPCDLRTYVSLPSRNKLLWNGIAHMFEKTLDDQERSFWTDHLETNIGLRLIQWLLGDQVDSVSEEFSHIFKVNVTYTLNCIPSCYIRMPEQITIPDVRLTTMIDVPIHVAKNTPEPFSATLILTSLDHKEIRRYRLDFQQLSEDTGAQVPSPTIPPFPETEQMPLSSDSSEEELI